jgi:hypothetical protein
VRPLRELALRQPPTLLLGHPGTDADSGGVPDHDNPPLMGREVFTLRPVRRLGRIYHVVMPIHAAKLLSVSERRRSARARLSIVSATMG